MRPASINVLELYRCRHRGPPSPPLSERQSSARARGPTLKQWSPSQRLDQGQPTSSQKRWERRREYVDVCLACTGAHVRGPARRGDGANATARRITLQKRQARTRGRVSSMTSSRMQARRHHRRNSQLACARLAACRGIATEEEPAASGRPGSPSPATCPPSPSDRQNTCFENKDARMLGSS